MILVTETIQIDDRELHERFVRAAGSRGQNARREATAVELSFNISESSLPDEVKARLKALAGRRMRSDGALVIVSRTYRSQTKNREATHERLRALVRRAIAPLATRREIGVSQAERERRLASKKIRSVVKRSRRSGLQAIRQG